MFSVNGDADAEFEWDRINSGSW